jgi:uncharacterized protein YdhG (YjbR/CyaY superfamily)
MVINKTPLTNASETKTGFQSIDQYVVTFPDHIQILLQEMRATIHAAAPDAEEKISY